MAPVSGELGVNSQNLLVRYASGPMVLKSVPVKSSVQLEQAMAIQEFCFENHAEVPKVFRTTEGALINKADGRAWALIEYIPSIPHSDEAILEKTALALAKLHQVLLDCPVEPSPKTGYQPLSTEEIALIDSKVSGSNDPFDVNTRCFLDMTSSLGGWESLESEIQLTHLDCHPGNLILSPADQLYVIDFGHIQRVPRMLAVSFCCHRLAGFDCRQTEVFLEAYSRIQRLSSSEQAKHFQFIAWESARRICFLLRHHFFEGHRDWDFELARKLSTLKEALSRQS